MISSTIDQRSLPRPKLTASSLAPRPAPQTAEIILAGAHGGAGTTTLAALLQPAWDLGAPRRTSDGDHPALRTGGRPVVLVARNTPAAAAHALAVLNAVAADGGRIAVLAVVSDGFPEPPAAHYRFRLLEARVGRVVRVPYVAALRLGGDPQEVRLPRRAQRALAAIRLMACAAVPPATARTPGR